MDIKILALEVARQHATDTEDLLKKAAKIEAYLTNQPDTSQETVLEKQIELLSEDATQTPTIEQQTADDLVYFRRKLDKARIRTSKPRNVHIPDWSEVPSIRKKIVNLRNGDPLIEQSIKEELGIDIPEEFSYETPQLITEMTEDTKVLSREYNEADDLVKLAKALTSNLEDLGYCGIDPAKMTEHARKEWQRHETMRKDRERLKKRTELLENCSDFFTAPVNEAINYQTESKVENYRIDRTIDRFGLVEENVPLSDYQLILARHMKEGNIILNVHRQFGTTTLIAAFAKQEAACGKKVLVLTNNHRAVCYLEALIDDGAVNVYDFNYVAGLAHAGEFYHHIIIDMASFIPYAIEERIKLYINKCNRAFLENQNARCASGYLPDLPLIAIASVPGMAQGWFYEAFTNNLDMRRVAVPWARGRLKKSDIQNLDPEVFANQFENKFRPVR